MFFVFGSNSTKQSYSMFIGTGLSQTDAQNTMVPARVLVPGGYQVSPSPGEHGRALAAMTPAPAC